MDWRAQLFQRGVNAGLVLAMDPKNKNRFRLMLEAAFPEVKKIEASDEPKKASEKAKGK